MNVGEVKKPVVKGRGRAEARNGVRRARSARPRIELGVKTAAQGHRKVIFLRCLKIKLSRQFVRVVSKGVLKGLGASRRSRDQTRFNISLCDGINLRWVDDSLRGERWVGLKEWIGLQKTGNACLIRRAREIAQKLGGGG